MAKKKDNLSANTTAVDVVGFLSALIYMQSVLTVAHHTSKWMNNGSTHIVEPPAVPALIIGLTIVVYAAYKDKSALTTLNVITLTILVTASLFWLLGLRTNFYF